MVKAATVAVAVPKARLILTATIIGARYGVLTLGHARKNGQFAPHKLAIGWRSRNLCEIGLSELFDVVPHEPVGRLLLFVDGKSEVILLLGLSNRVAAMLMRDL
jgi:hypothetical protein